MYTRNQHRRSCSYVVERSLSQERHTHASAIDDGRRDTYRSIRCKMAIDDMIHDGMYAGDDDKITKKGKRSPCVEHEHDSEVV